MSDIEHAVVFTKNEVIIKDIKMPFWSMVTFMVKWAIAAIPAILILAVIFSVVVGIVTGLSTSKL